MGLRDWWADVTPWDTNYERSQQRSDYVDDVQQAIDDAYNNIAPPPQPVDDDGDGRPDRLINPETGETLQDYSRINEMLQSAQEAGQNLPSFDEWLSDTGRTFTPVTESEPYLGLDDLIAQMEAGPTDEEWNQAYEHSARMLGLTAEEYQELVGGLTQRLAQGVSGQQGMGDAERALRERDIRAQTRVAEERAQRMIENIRANSGSSTRAYMAADQALRSINDYELQQQVALADEEYRRRAADFEAKERHFAQMVERGQMGVSQYMDVLQSSKAQAFQGYAMQMNAVMQQNTQYLQMHQQELGRLQQHVQNMYMAVNAEMGVSTHITQQIQDYYGLELAQFEAELAAITTNFQLEATKWAIEDQSRSQVVSTIFGGLQIIAGAVLMAVPGIGPVIGAPLLASGGSTIASGFGADVAVPDFTGYNFDNSSSSSSSSNQTSSAQGPQYIPSESLYPGYHG